MIRPKPAPFTDIELVRRAGVVRYNPRETRANRFWKEREPFRRAARLG